MNRIVCKAIALYGREDKVIDYNRFYKWALNFFEQQGCKPNYIGVSGKGYPKKIVKFEIGEKKIKAKDFADIESLNFIFNTPHSDAPAYDWLLSVSIGVNDNTEIFIGGNIDTINFSSEVDLLKSLRQIVDFEYGYIFLREFIKNPEFYIGGAGSDFISNEETASISKWLHDSFSAKSYRKGKLRDLYDINILNNKQLNYKISESQTLLDFINSKPKEEQDLKQILDDLYIWIISPKKIMKYRNELSQSNILICYDQLVEPTFSIHEQYQSKLDN